MSLSKITSRSRPSAAIRITCSAISGGSPVHNWSTSVRENAHRPRGIRRWPSQRSVMRERPSGLAGSSVSAPSARSRGRGTARYRRRSISSVKVPSQMTSSGRSSAYRRSGARFASASGPACQRLHRLPHVIGHPGRQDHVFRQHVPDEPPEKEGPGRQRVTAQMVHADHDKVPWQGTGHRAGQSLAFRRGQEIRPARTTPGSPAALQPPLPGKSPGGRRPADEPTGRWRRSLLVAVVQVHRAQAGHCAMPGQVAQDDQGMAVPPVGIAELRT
jgi:hypothetical protein